jgi:murein DD-endopeptidase MepM/ murein hydrolase activator NlpD
MTVAELLALNGLTENQVLRVGQILRVAGETGNTGNQTVSEGNSLPDIHDVQERGDARSGGGESLVREHDVPFWPVSGMKRPLDGKIEGVVIQADSASFIHSVASGTVVWVGPYRGFGNVVLVESGDFIYLYGGNENIFVNVGETVQRGTRIGQLAREGSGNGQYDVFFSVFRNGSPVDTETAPRI